MILTLLIVVFIFLMQFLWLYIDDLAGKGLSWLVLLEFMGWLSITFIPLTLPLSTLLASLMTMGDLGENNELLALKASGISLNRILYPLYGAIFCVGVFSFMMSSDLVPKAYVQMRLMFRDIQKTRPELSIPEGIFYNGIDNFSIRVDKKDPNTGILLGVMIYNHSDNAGNVEVTIADSGYIKQTASGTHLVFRLINGIVYQEQLQRGTINTTTRGFMRRSFKEQTVTIDIQGQSNMSSEGMFRDMALSKSLKDLNKDRDSVSQSHLVLMTQFQQQYVFSNSSFNYASELDTAYNRRAASIYPVKADSLFTTKNATEKIILLKNAITSVERVRDYWSISINEIENKTKQMNSLNFEWHRKFTLSIACILFFFIGAPLGAIIRKGGLGMPVIVSVFFFVIYYVVDSICQKMVKSDVWIPWFGAWFPTVMLLPIAVFLTYKANTDSQLFDSEVYIKFLNRFLARVEKLVVRINLDQIQIRPMDISNDELSANILELSRLCDQFLGKHPKAKLTQESSFILDLETIHQKYQTMLAYVAGIDDDQRLRTVITDYPHLEVSKYQIKKYSFQKRLLMGLVFPVYIGRKIVANNQYRQLKYILTEIITINNNLRKAIENGHTA